MKRYAFLTAMVSAALITAIALTPMTSSADAPALHLKPNAATASTLVITGNVPTLTAINLYSGWNLAGYPAAVSRALPGALNGIDFSLVYAYHAGDTLDPWKLFDAAAPGFSDLVALTPGWGYWIKASSNALWQVP